MLPVDTILAALLAGAIALAILAVELDELMHAIICFWGLCVALGGAYAMLGAPYAALFQILIYAGAVIVLFIIAIMLTKR